jgi:hypothetical protein
MKVGDLVKSTHPDADNSIVWVVVSFPPPSEQFEDAVEIMRLDEGVRVIVFAYNLEVIS